MLHHRRIRRRAGHRWLLWPLPRSKALCRILMLASGADIAVMSKLLGHASIAITADVYGHLIGTIASEGRG